MQQKKLAILNMTLLASSAVVVDGFKLKNVSKWEGESPLIFGSLFWGPLWWKVMRFTHLPPPPHQFLFIQSKLDRPGLVTPTSSIRSIVPIQ
jgi:hypothetical protein